MAQIIQETLTVADSKNKTIGVASALGNALAAMSGSTAESVANQTVQALNDLATDVSCSAAASSAASKWLPCCGHRALFGSAPLETLGTRAQGCGHALCCDSS